MIQQKFHLTPTSAIFVRSASKFQSFDFLYTFLKLRNIKMIILCGHQDIANTTLIPLQLWHTSFKHKRRKRQTMQLPK